MRLIVVLGLVALLSACGADGEPTQPTMNGAIGVSSDGAFGAIGVSNGPVTISVGTGRGCYYCW